MREQPIEIECGYDVTLAWRGHGLDHEAVLSWAPSYGLDGEAPEEVWLVADHDINGYDDWYWNVPPGTEGAEPFTILCRSPWRVEEDWQELRADALGDRDA